MIISIRLGAALIAGALLVGCASQSTLHPENAVTQIIVMKEARKMYLMHNDTVMRSYNIGLGFSPAGDKKVAGDGKTPEGDYFIDRRNPYSRFYLSLGISYPNYQDHAEARSLGMDPGGDIFIHGFPNDYDVSERDWTWGCIAVTNEEMNEIYSLVDEGTRITIRP